MTVTCSIHNIPRVAAPYNGGQLYTCPKCDAKANLSELPNVVVLAEQGEIEAVVQLCLEALHTLLEQQRLTPEASYDVWSAYVSLVRTLPDPRG